MEDFVPWTVNFAYVLMVGLAISANWILVAFYAQTMTVTAMIMDTVISLLVIVFVMVHGEFDAKFQIMLVLLVLLEFVNMMDTVPWQMRDVYVMKVGLVIFVNIHQEVLCAIRTMDVAIMDGVLIPLKIVFVLQEIIMEYFVKFHMELELLAVLNLA